MLGVEGYSSDSDNESNNAHPPAPPLAIAKDASQSRKAKKPQKKITIGLPELSAVNVDGDDLRDERPAVKKPRLESGAGVSSLLSMLPDPKRNEPASHPKARQRVLGGGAGPALSFSSTALSKEPIADDDGQGSREERTSPTDAMPFSTSQASSSCMGKSSSMGPISQLQYSSSASNFFFLGMFRRCPLMIPFQI